MMKTAAAMDVPAPKIGEIIGGSQREERARQNWRDRSRAESRRFRVVSDLRRYGTGRWLLAWPVGYSQTGMGNIRAVPR